MNVYESIATRCNKLGFLYDTELHRGTKLWTLDTLKTYVYSKISIDDRYVVC